MKILSVILGYLKWHYGKALVSLTRVWGNFLYFIREYFSLRLLFTNFFDPWKRMSDSYPKGFDLKKIFYTMLGNFLTRIIGIFLRAGLIIVGLAVYGLTALLYLVALILWLTLPVIIAYLLLGGLILIIK